MPSRRWPVSCAILLLAACGEGGGDGDQSCKPAFGPADACGGSLEGRWKYVKACAGEEAIAPLKALCPGATVRNVATTLTTGALSFEAGSFSLTVVAQVSFETGFPATCAALAGGCTGAPDALKAAMPGASAFCTGNSDCTCQVSTPVSANRQGSLTISAGVAAVSSGEQYYFCVSGGALRYHGVPGKASGDDTVTYVLLRD